MPLRLANIEEASILTEISIKAFHTDYLVGGDINDGPPDYDSLKWHKKMIKENHLFSYVDNNDTLIGGCILFKYNKLLYIGRMFISPIYFNQGYGIKMMQEIENIYDDITEIKLETPTWNIRTNSLYKKLGYKEISRTSEDICYRKQIL